MRCKLAFSPLAAVLADLIGGVSPPSVGLGDRVYAWPAWETGPEAPCEQPPNPNQKLHAGRPRGQLFRCLRCPCTLDDLAESQPPSARCPVLGLLLLPLVFHRGSCPCGLVRPVAAALPPTHPDRGRLSRAPRGALLAGGASWGMEAFYEEVRPLGRQLGSKASKPCGRPLQRDLQAPTRSAARHPGHCEGIRILRTPPSELRRNC